MSSGTTAETRPSNSNNNSRYWCHICNAEVNIYMAPDPTCQQCNEQFIEELHSDDDPREFLSGINAAQPTTEGGGELNISLPGGGTAQIFSYSPSTGRFANVHGGPGGGTAAEMGDDIFQYFTPETNRTNNEQGAGDRTVGGGEAGAGGGRGGAPLNNFLQNILTGILGQNIEISTGPGGGTTAAATEGGEEGRPMMFYGSMVDGNMTFQPMPGTGGGGTRMPGAMPDQGANNDNNNNNDGQQTGDRERGLPRGNNIASILQFLSAMVGGEAGLVGNPNDYVFTQTALDDIITRLMEQTGGNSAPPPAPEQVIESLKKRELTDEEKSTETDCAVCKDQFEPHEQVIELPCEHIFHDDCIKPWLKLNSTCPVCRHSVLPEGEGENANRDSNNNNTSSAGNNTNNNGSSDSNNNNNTQQQQQNNNDSQNNNNSGGTRTATATFSWVGGNGGGQQQGGGGWPLNLSAAFPWNLTSPGAGNSPRTQHNTTTSTSPQPQQSSSSNNDNNNSSSSHPFHHHEDLDLD